MLKINSTKCYRAFRAIGFGFGFASFTSTSFLKVCSFYEIILVVKLDWLTELKQRKFSFSSCFQTTHSESFSETKTIHCFLPCSVEYHIRTAKCSVQRIRNQIAVKFFPTNGDLVIVNFRRICNIQEKLSIQKSRFSFFFPDQNWQLF